jgi:hypothetical protein
LEDRGLLSDAGAGAGGVVLLATGDTHNLQHAANMWLQSTAALKVQQLV